MHDEALFSWRWINTCLLRGSGELIPYFALLARAALSFPFKLF